VQRRGGVWEEGERSWLDCCLFEYAEGHWVAEELASVGGDGGVDHAYSTDDGDSEEEDGGEPAGEDSTDSEDECPEEE